MWFLKKDSTHLSDLSKFKPEPDGIYKHLTTVFRERW